MRLGFGAYVGGPRPFTVRVHLKHVCRSNQIAEHGVSVAPRVEIRVPVSEDAVDAANFGPVVAVRGRLDGRP